MRQIKTEIEINTTINKVWEILTNFEKYPDWNPFIKSIEGEVQEGNKFQVTIQLPDSKPMVFKPRCLKFFENKEFSWLGHLFIKGLFDGEHIFELIELPSRKTKFIQRENFTGLLVLVLWKQISIKTRKGFELMNGKIKELVEK